MLEYLADVLSLWRQAFVPNSPRAELSKTMIERMLLLFSIHGVSTCMMVILLHADIAYYDSCRLVAQSTFVPGVCWLLMAKNACKMKQPAVTLLTTNLKMK